MNEYVICTRRENLDEIPLQPVLTVEAYGFAHALEKALSRWTEWPRQPEIGDIVVVKLVTEDTVKVFKILDGDPWHWERP